MPYYHDLVTRKSWEELQSLRKKLEFVLIGGWAAYLYTKTLKSKDIDIIVDFNQLETLAASYHLSKNERLKKYEAVKEEVQIDIYLPHYSRLGIPVHILRQKTRSVEGFTLLHPDYLLALKIYVLSLRGRSPKGEKDFMDCLALIRSGAADIKAAAELLKNHGLAPVKQMLLSLLKEHREIPELDLNARRFARLRRLIEEKP